MPTHNTEPIVGPRNPMAPLGPPRSLGEGLTVTDFEDGLEYEIKVPKGGDLAGLVLQLNLIGSGQIINMWDPADLGDMVDDFFYVQVWVATERG